MLSRHWTTIVSPKEALKMKELPTLLTEHSGALRSIWQATLPKDSALVTLATHATTELELLGGVGRSTLGTLLLLMFLMGLSIKIH